MTRCSKVERKLRMFANSEDDVRRLLQHCPLPFASVKHLGDHSCTWRRSHSNKLYFYHLLGGFDLGSFWIFRLVWFCNFDFDFGTDWMTDKARKCSDLGQIHFYASIHAFRNQNIDWSRGQGPSEAMAAEIQIKEIGKRPINCRIKPILAFSFLFEVGKHITLL